MEEEEEEEEDVLLLLLVVVAVVVLDGLGGGAPWGAAGGISRDDAGFMCPASSPGRDRGATWDTEEERVP